MKYPLCVTRTWRRPSFLNISMTVSIGVWSVTVMGAKSKMRLSFNGVDPCHGDGILGVNRTKESSPRPSCVRLALATSKQKERESTKEMDEMNDEKGLYRLPARDHDATRTRRGTAILWTRQRGIHCDPFLSKANPPRSYWSYLALKLSMVCWP